MNVGRRGGAGVLIAGLAGVGDLARTRSFRRIHGGVVFAAGTGMIMMAVGGQGVDGGMVAGMIWLIPGRIFIITMGHSGRVSLLNPRG